MIRELELNNWKCHSKLSCTFKEGVNFIIGFNGVGKTSILEAIVFGLIGRVRTKNKKMFKKIDGTGDSNVLLKFVQNNEKFEIKRPLIGSPVLKRSSGRDITSNDGVLEFILNVFNSNQSFLENILYSPEGETYEFLKLNSKDLINFLEKLIGIGKLNEFRNIILKIQKVLEKKKKINENQLKVLKEIEFEEDLGEKKKLENEKRSIIEKKQLLREKCNIIDEEILQIKKEKEKFYDKNYKFKIRISNIERLFNRNRELFSELNIEDFNIQKILLRTQEIENDLTEGSKRLDILNKKSKVLNKEFIENKIKLEERMSIKEIIDKLKHNFEEKLQIYCPLCKKKLTKDEFVQSHSDTLKEIDDLNKEKENIKQLSNETKRERKYLNQKVKVFKEFVNILESINDFNESRISEIEDKIDEYDQKIGKKEAIFKELHAERRNHVQNLFEIDKSLSKLKLAEKVKDALKYEKNYNDSIKGLLMCEITIEALDRVLKSQRNVNLDELISEIQDIWKIFFPFEERKLYFDKQYIPYFEQGKEKIPYNNISGGEKMILLILIKTLLLKKYTRIPFLILDEPLEHLNFNNRINIIDYLINIHKKGLIKQLIITTFEESLTRKYVNSDEVNIISLPSLKKYQII